MSATGAAAVIDAAHCRSVLQERGLLPEDTRSACLTGSVARGWAHPGSDVDLLVITDARASLAYESEVVAALTPSAVPVVRFRDQERQWEIKYWLSGQIDQLFAKVSWDAFDENRIAGSAFTMSEKLFLARLGSTVALTGAEWLEQRKKQLTDSAFRSFLTREALAEADDTADAAMGQLAAGDLDGAVLAARDAFGWSIEALLASHGEFTTAVKWRSRRYHAANPTELSYADYWAVETMRDLDPADPRAWVEHVVDLCKTLSLRIEV